MLSNSDDGKLKENIFTKVMKVEGVGKYPYVVVKKCLESQDLTTATMTTDFSENFHDLIVDFGPVAVGNSVDKCVLVNNPSLVSYAAKFNRIIWR